MRKLAVFVEGYTELEFVDRLVTEVAGANNVAIEHRKILGGARVARTTKIIHAVQPTSGQKYYVLIVDCGGDDQVKTRIVEEHTNLANSNYVKIIGIRDVRPKFTRTEIPKLEMGLKTRIKTSLIPVEFILSIMEIEAWFLAEASHFPRIDPAITVSAIAARLGFDPERDDMSVRSNPSVDLDACYRIGGKTYSKGVGVTVCCLDFSAYYFDLRTRIPNLDKLLTSLESFIS